MVQLFEDTQPHKDYCVCMAEDNEEYVTACTRVFDAYVLCLGYLRRPWYRASIGEVI